jgi:hypothetical protein
MFFLYQSIDIKLLPFGSMFACVLNCVFISNFSRLSVASLHCEFIWSIRLAVAAFVALYCDMVAPWLEFTTIRSSLSLKHPRTVTVRSYKVRKKQELQIVVNSKYVATMSHYDTTSVAAESLSVQIIEIIEYIECSCVDCTCSSMDRENIAPSATFSIYSGRSGQQKDKLSLFP